MSEDLSNGFLGPGGYMPPEPPGADTLAKAYADGTLAADQTLSLLDAKGGAVTIDGTAPGFTGAYGFRVLANVYVSQSLAIGTDSPAVPTARLHLPAGTAVAGTAPLKIDGGVLLAVPSAGAIESDGTNLYWTDGGGTRHTLNNATLAQTYAVGTGAADQTFALLDAKGGALILDATAAGFTGTNALTINANGGGSVAFPRTSGVNIAVASTIASAAGAVWNAVKVGPATAAITGNTNIATATGFNCTTFNAPVISGNLATCTITNAATLAIAGPPTAGANVAITNPYAFWIQSGILAISGTGDMLNLLGSSNVIQVNAYTNTDFRLIQRSNAPMTFWTNGSERMRVSGTGDVGIGTNNPTSKLQLFDGTVAEAKFNSGAGSTTPNFCVGNTGASGKFLGFIAGSANPLITFDNSAALLFLAETKNDYTNKIVGSAGTVTLSIFPTGSVVIAPSALATNATDGFLYIPSCAGTPTGVPTAHTGTVAMVYDTTNNKLYIYNGGWKGGTAPGTWS